MTIMTPIVMQTNFADLKLVNRGKVRDIYDLGEHLLIVTSDRISAFDVIMNEGIPNKGFVLTQGDPKGGRGDCPADNAAHPWDIASRD
jgi:hypothetical protein